MSRRPRSSPENPDAGGVSDEVIRGLSRILQTIVDGLTAEERDRFALEFANAIRSNDADAIHEILSSWLVTAAVRKHPDFERQTAEFQKLVRSGALYEGVDLASLRP